MKENGYWHGSQCPLEHEYQKVALKGGMGHVSFSCWKVAGCWLIQNPGVHLPLKAKAIAPQSQVVGWTDFNLLWIDPLSAVHVERMEECSKFFFSHRDWSLNPSPEYFPAELNQCAALFCPAKCPFQAETTDLDSLAAKTQTCILEQIVVFFWSQILLLMSACSFGGLQKLRAHLHRPHCGLLIPILFSNSWGKHLGWAGSLRSWTSALHFPMRGSRASYKITLAFILLSGERERKQNRANGII